MRLTDKEIDRLYIFTAGEMARRRKMKGLKLNYPESIALISDEILEAARAGASYEEVLDFAGRILKRDDVLEGVPELVQFVQLEVTFPDGTRLVTIRHPIS